MPQHPDRIVLQATVHDALHFTPEMIEQQRRSYGKHELDARLKGVPVFGSGLVFPIEEEFFTVPPIEIPEHWPQIGGIDFGWDHPSAGANLAWDRDADCLYVTKVHRAREQTPIMFSAAVKPWGDWLKWAWPHDGLQHDKGSGEQLAQQYRMAGLNMLPERASFQDGSNGVEAGITEMLDRLQTGRLKVFSSCVLWFDEFRMYHRENGLIVKEDDDLMSATRYAMMMRRFATVKLKRKQPIMDTGGGGWMR